MLSCPSLTCQLQQLWFCSHKTFARGSLGIFSPSKGAWESMRNPPKLGESPKPSVPDLSETMAKLLEAPHLQFSPFPPKQRFSPESVRHSESLDTMKSEKGLAAILDHFAWVLQQRSHISFCLPPKAQGWGGRCRGSFLTDLCSMGHPPS